LQPPTTTVNPIIEAELFFAAENNKSILSSSKINETAGGMSSRGAEIRRIRRKAVLLLQG
jgi:hypothetical protein